MEKVDVIRLERSDQGVFGVLRVGGWVQCLTLEPPDRNNQANVSCIPAGRYVCQKRKSHRFGPTWEVLNVPDRSDILFHAGNRASDSRGCILLGGRMGELEGQRALLGSRSAVQDFRSVLGSVDEFELSVAEAYCTQKTDEEL